MSKNKSLQIKYTILNLINNEIDRSNNMSTYCSI